MPAGFISNGNFCDTKIAFVMFELSKIYDPAFFKTWGKSNRAYVDSAFRIARVLYDYFQPKSLIDWGCGAGAHSFFFRRQGVRVLSIDAVPPPEDEKFPIEIVEHDLTEPITTDLGKFDLAVCFDVAEHIPVEHQNIFLSNITRFSDRLLLSCAPPWQGGHHHVNEQPKRYWIQSLESHGFHYLRRKTGELIETFKAMQSAMPLEYAWMFRHISVYERFNKCGANYVP